MEQTFRSQGDSRSYQKHFRFCTKNYRQTHKMNYMLLAIIIGSIFLAISPIQRNLKI